jgi:alkylmercury lyase
MAIARDLTSALLPAFPELGPDSRALVGPLFVLLGQGHPVSPASLARAVGRPHGEVRGQLADWWGVRYDRDGRIIGFWGLDLFPTRQQIRVGQRDLFAWCAWDALCLAPLLGEELEVTSLCPASGDDIRLRVAPEGVLDVEPDDVRLALRLPSQAAGAGGSRDTVAREGRFLVDNRAAAEWSRSHPGLRLLSVDEGHRLGRAVWEALLGSGG